METAECDVKQSKQQLTPKAGWSSHSEEWNSNPKIWSNCQDLNFTTVSAKLANEERKIETNIIISTYRKSPVLKLIRLVDKIDTKMPQQNMINNVTF